MSLRTTNTHYTQYTWHDVVDGSVDLLPLVYAITQGDQGALSSLYRHYVFRAYSLAYRIVRSREYAQQILNDVFVCVWHNAHVFDATLGRVEAWISTITRSRAIDYLRTHPRLRSLSQRFLDRASRVAISDCDDLLSDFQVGSSIYGEIAPAASFAGVAGSH